MVQQNHRADHSALGHRFGISRISDSSGGRPLLCRSAFHSLFRVHRSPGEQGLQIDTAQRELIFGKDLPLPKRHHVLSWAPSPIFGEIRGPKFWVQFEGIGKFQAIVTKFCRATTVGQRNMPAKFQLNRFFLVHEIRNQTLSEISTPLPVCMRNCQMIIT